MIGIFVFFIFFAFRGFVFTDWVTYYVEFDEASWSMLTNYELGTSREPLFLLLELICKSIFDNYHFLVFVCTTINVVLLIRFFRLYTDNILLAIVLYLGFNGFEISCNLLRNVIAICIFLNAIPYLERRKPLQYFGMCLLALGFHFSAVLYLPLCFFFQLRISRWVYATIIAVCFVVFLFHIPIFMRLISLIGIGGAFIDFKLDAYSEMGGQLGLGMGFVERFITASLVFCYLDKLMELRSTNKIFINALVAYFVCTFMFSEFTEISKRLSTLFVFSYWILWGDMIKVFSIRNNRRLFVSFLFLYCLVKTVTTINQPFNQYDNILLGNSKSYQERKYIFDKTFEEAKY